MRTVPSAITNAEVGSALHPTHAATVQNELLSFNTPTANSNASLDIGVPQNYGLRSGSNLGYTTYRYTNGTHYVRVVDVTSPGDFQLNSSTVIGTSATMYAMRSGIHTSVGATYLYTAYPSGGAIQVRRATLTSTINPPSVSFSNYNGTFGQALMVISTFIRRVEAVCPTDDGVIVAIGEHDFINSLSTVTFYWLPSSSVSIIQLNTIIQLPLTETFSAWYSNAKHCTFISAISDGAGTICVVANALSSGRAVTFTIKNGIESELRAVVPTDVEATNVSFAASSISRVGNLYCMAGRMTRRNSDGSAIGYDCYLTSDDLREWSLGERNHYLMSQQGFGTLLHPDNGSMVYYVGNLYHTAASATPIQYPFVTGQSLVLDSRIAGWSVTQNSNQADSFDCTLANTDGALTGSGVLKRGSVLYLDTGQDGVNADFGVYGVDSIDEGVDENGRSLMNLNGRDIAGKRLADWKCPVDVWLESMSKIRTPLTDLKSMILKTPQGQGYKFSTAHGLYYTGLNEPFVAYADAPHVDNTLSKMLVQFDILNNWHVSSIGVLIGASDDTSGNVVLIPKFHNWPGYTQGTAKIRKLAMPAIDTTDPDKDDTGFNLVARTNSLWVQSGNGALRTSAVTGGTERTASAFQFPVGAAYDVAVRTAGRRVQVFTKANNYAPASTSTNAGWTLIYEYLFDYQTRMRPSKKSYSGLALCTDVFVDTMAFKQAEYGDIENSLTDAANKATPSDFGQYIGVCQRIGTSLFSFVNFSRMTYEGQYLKVNGVVTKIVSKSGSGINDNFTLSYVPSGWPNYQDFDTYMLSDADEWGWASSGQKNYTEFGGATRLNDPRAVQRARVTAGRAAFISNDNTAMTIRMIESDGVKHSLRSGAAPGATGLTRLGWDATNPLAASSIPPFNESDYSGSAPDVWRIVFHHGRFFPVSATSKQLPSAGYFRVEDEKIRYADTSFLRPGELNSETWCCIPTYYTPLASSAAGASVLTQYSGGSGLVGDRFIDIPDVAGMLVEITNRNNDGTEDSNQFYAQSAALGASSTLTLDRAYPNEIRALEAIAIVSGRGQFGTRKVKHSAESPVVYDPLDPNTGNSASIKVRRYDYYSGLYLSVQDAIERISSLSGQRDVTFRTAFSAGNETTPYTFTGSTTATTLPLYEDMANFTLDLNALISGQTRLYVEFRNYYRLALQYVGVGQLLCGLLTTSADISPDGNGDRWLEYVTVPITDYDFGGQNCDVRLAVQDGLVTVQMNRQHVWTFNLDHFTDGTNSYKRTSVGPVRVLYSGSVGGNTATARVQELGDPVAGFAMRKTQTARATIDELMKERHIKSRATATGGIEFGQFRVRDNAGTLQKNLLKDNWKLEDVRNAGHVEVTGDGAVGEALDDATLRTEGYKFDVGDNKLATTAAQCVLDARLWLREMKEAQEIRSVSGYGRIALQPEDQITLVYTPGGDVPAHSSSNHVLNGVALTADNKSVKGTYTLRKHVSTF